MIRALITAFKNLFTPVHTINYPKEDIVLPEQYRGLIEFDEEYCIFCDKCEKVCPPQSIVFKQNEDGTKTYNYNAWLCIYCGECVRACPKAGEALWQSELKPQSALKEEDVNNRWTLWQEESAQSRVAYKKKPKSKK